MSRIQVFNEDCYKAIKNIPDKSIDLIYTDIPYDLEGNGGGGAFGSKKRNYHKEYEKVSENTGVKESNFGIDYSILNEYLRVLKKTNIYIWCSKKQFPHILNYFLDKGCFWDLFVWHKTNPVPTCNNKYLSDTEYCLIFRERGVNVFGTYKTKSKYYISSINKKDKDLYGHPTIKPLEIVKNHIINSTQVGGVVLDTFLGSGTTAVACKELDRDFIGFELNKEYYDIAINRINENNQKVEEEQLMLFDEGE